ncbi:hypothetical protein, partial [Nocardia farcinica]|uniref:hypothetical protein n=1 Tax=Nocardia farcinica TaxID=37329 RepID=UPI002456AD0F
MTWAAAAACTRSISAVWSRRSCSRSARLLAGIVRGRVGFAAAERWQTRYLPVFRLWAALVVA